MLRLPACLLLFICVIIAYNINLYYIKLYTHYFEAMFHFYFSFFLFASSSSSYSLVFSHCVFVENFDEIVLNNVAIMLSKDVSKKNLPFTIAPLHARSFSSGLIFRFRTNLVDILVVDFYLVFFSLKKYNQNNVVHINRRVRLTLKNNVFLFQ